MGKRSTPFYWGFRDRNWFELEIDFRFIGIFMACFLGSFLDPLWIFSGHFLPSSLGKFVGIKYPPLALSTT
jgi:hypothetical protein